MQISKREIVKEINELATDLFSISVEDKNRSKYREALKGKLWVKLWFYYKKQYSKIDKNGSSMYEIFSGVINETIGNCCLNYKLEQGTPFIHYVNAAVKKEINSERQRTKLYGLKVPKEISVLCNQLEKISESKGITNYNEILRLGLLIVKDEHKVKEALEIMKIKNSSFSETIKNNNEEENSIFDFYKSKIENPEEMLEAQIDFAEIINKLDTIEACFLKSQKRTQEYLSALLTHKLYKEIKVFELKNNKVLNYSFIDRKIFEEFSKFEKLKTRIFSQQDVAKQFGRNKTDASRTLKIFFEKVKKIYFKKC